MEFYEVIEKRRSIRQFEDREIPKEMCIRDRSSLRAAHTAFMAKVAMVQKTAVISGRPARNRSIFSTFSSYCSGSLYTACLLYTSRCV